MALGGTLGHILRETGHQLANVGDAALADVEQIVKHPGYLAGLFAGPEGPFLLAELNRRGAFKGITGAFGGGGHARVPKAPFKPGETGAPQPGDFPIMTFPGGAAKCGSLAAWGAEGAQPFSLVGYKLLAAGAQTQGTDLFDFHDATSNPTVITTNNLIPGNIEVFEASLYVGVKMLTTLGSENTAFLSSFWIVERVNGIEKARWSLKQLGATVSHTGLTTSGGSAFTAALDLPSVPWHRKYDPNVPHELAVQLSVTTTTIQATEWCLVEKGIRP